MCVWCGVCTHVCLRACVNVLVHTWVCKLNTGVRACATSSLQTGPPDPLLTFLTLHVLENKQNFQNCCQVNTVITATGVRNQGGSLHPPPSSLGSPKSLKVSIELLVAHVLVCSSQHLKVLLSRHLGRCLMMRVFCLLVLIQSLSLPLQRLSPLSALCFAAFQSVVLLRQWRQQASLFCGVVFKG